MDRRAWRATVHGVTKYLDMTERLSRQDSSRLSPQDATWSKEMLTEMGLRFNCNCSLFLR